MESIRIYVPQSRVGELAVWEALDKVIQDGATLYNATGTWNNGQRVVSEQVMVVEVLDSNEGRRESIDHLVDALLAAGEEAVLIAKQQTITHLLVRGDSVRISNGTLTAPLLTGTGNPISPG